MHPLRALIVSLMMGAGLFAMQDRRVISAGPPMAEIGTRAVVAGGLVYVSGVTGLAVPNASGRPAANASVADETTLALARLNDALEAGGSSLALAANVNVYLRRASDFAAMNDAYRAAFPADPPARTTVVADVPNGALVQISAVGVVKGGTREALLPEGWMKSPRPYSYAIRTDDLVFLSGLVSRRPKDDATVEGTPEKQTATIMDNAGDLLDAAGLSYDDVVASRVFITDSLYFDDMNRVYGSYFPNDPPARATAVTDLMGADSRVEIALIASTHGKQVVGPSVAPSLPVSAVVRAGRRYFLAGVLGNTDANAHDPAAQSVEVFDRLRHTFALGDLAFGDVVDSTVYLRDLDDLARVMPAVNRAFPKDAPALTLVQAPLVPLTARVEVLLAAYK